MASFLTLTCNECMDDFSIGDSSVFDLSLYSSTDVRALAFAAGWKRYGSSDLCKKCADVQKGGAK